MTTIPDGFPAGLSDTQLAAIVDEWIAGYAKLYGDVGPQLPELKLALINAALQEQSRRETAELRRVSQNTARSAIISLRVAQAALAIAALTLVATVVLTFVD